MCTVTKEAGRQQGRGAAPALGPHPYPALVLPACMIGAASLNVEEAEACPGWPLPNVSTAQKGRCRTQGLLTGSSLETLGMLPSFIYYLAGWGPDGYRFYVLFHRPLAGLALMPGLR